MSLGVFRCRGSYQRSWSSRRLVGGGRVRRGKAFSGHSLRFEPVEATYLPQPPHLPQDEVEERSRGQAKEAQKGQDPIRDCGVDELQVAASAVADDLVSPRGQIRHLVSD